MATKEEIYHTYIMFPSKRKRCDLTLQEKLDIISYHEMNKGKTQNELASYFSTNDKTINRTTISKIIKQKEELVKKSKREYDYLHMKRERETYYPTIENALLLWFSQARQLGLAITEDLLKLKAMEIKECLLEVLQTPEEKEKLSHFSASNGWIYRFRKRNAIKSRFLSGESSSVNTDYEELGRKELMEETKNYNAEDIFNADETALYFRIMPSISLIMKHENSHGKKRIRRSFQF